MTRRFAIAAVMTLCGSSWALAADPAAPVIVGRWDFEKPGDLEGWVAGPNVTDMKVADGHLSFKTVTNDPFIYAPRVRCPLDGCVVRVALRCKMATDTQVYWTTPDFPNFGEQKVINRYAPGRTDGFTVLEFPIGKPSDVGTQLTGFRIDPCGGPVGEVGEIDYVELVRVPPLLEVSLSFDRHLVPARQSSRLSVAMRQIAGWKDNTQRVVRIADKRPADCKVPGTQPAPISGADIRYTAAGVHQEQALVSEAGSTRYDLQSSIIVGQADKLPLVPAIRTDHLRLDFVQNAQGDQVGAARFRAADDKGGWQLAGWLLPLCRITLLTDRGSILQREPMLQLHAASESWARLEGKLPAMPDWRIQIDMSVLKHAEAIEVTATLTGPEGGKVLEFAAPTLRVDRQPPIDPLDRYAVFGGLEMLEPGWSSSSERSIGEKYAVRHTPHPFKISLPMMAVEAGGLTTALMWQPLDAWGGTQRMPAATFASPNFLDGQANHLMRLWAPSVPEYVAENQLYARQPYIMTKSQPLKLRYVLIAERNLPAMLAARRWFEIFGMPELQAEPHDDRSLYHLIAASYGETMYYPDKNGWTQHWFFNQPPAYQPEMAAFLVGHAADTGQQQWVEKTKLVGRTLIDAAVPLATRIEHGDGLARAMISSMQPDGTWPFHNTDQIRKTALQVTDGKYDNLGKDGATELGICAGNALAILRQAEMSGDPEITQAGLKTLEAMRRFHVPRGAQVWEVHLEIPDIRAAALAVEAFHIGYKLTGDKKYLEDASYWAWTGVPFIYSWRVPSDRVPGSFVGSRDRNATARQSMPLDQCYQSANPQVTPYGTLPVLGPTYYVINWFGVLVQWCGLEWAQKIIDLNADRPDPMLRAIADGVIVSGLQQMMDKPPWVGLYPDSWLLEQNIAQPAMIYPGLILACRQSQGRLPTWSKPWTRVIADETSKTRWHVSGWGKPVALGKPGSKTWSAQVEFLKGQPSELLLARVEAPNKIVIDAAELPRQEKPGEPGWTYTADRHLLIVRFRHAEPKASLTIEW